MGAVSVTAGFSAGGLSAPITAAGETQAVRTARTGDNKLFGQCIFLLHLNYLISIRSTGAADDPVDAGAAR
jgi:hypothetical protein